MVKSLAENYGVDANQRVFVVGKLRFSNLLKKDEKSEYPSYNVTIEDPKFSNPDGSHEGKFIDAMKSTVYEAKDGTKCITLTFKDSERQPFLNLVGHAEGGTIKSADEVLSGKDGESSNSYLTTGQPVKACVRSYNYTYKNRDGIGQSLNYLEISSIENPQVSGGTSVNINEGDDPFGDMEPAQPKAEPKDEKQSTEKADNPFDEPAKNDTANASGEGDSDLPF